MISDAQRETTLAAWLSEYRGILHKVARAYAPEEADRADLRQEMAVQIWRSLPAFREQSSAATWIYRVCLNTAISWRRQVSRRERELVPGVDLQEIRESTQSPAERADEQELIEQLYTAIQALPDFDRALVLLALDGVAYREIAEVTGLTENHVGVALTRARQRLAARLKGVTHELE